MTRLRLLSKPQEFISLIRTLRSASFTKITFKGLIYSIPFVLLLFREGGPLPYGVYQFFCVLRLLNGRSRTPVPTGGINFCVLRWLNGRSRTPVPTGYVNFAFCVCCGRADPSPTVGINFLRFALIAGGRTPPLRGYQFFAFCVG